MPKCHLTQDFLLQLIKNPPHKTVQYTDKDLTGFVLEYRSTSVGTWYFRYRYGQAKLQYARIGSTERMDALAARECAYRLASIVREGGDPQQKAVFKPSSLTVEGFVLERYLPHAELKKRSWRVDARILRQYFFSHFGERYLHSITCMEMVAWQNSLPTKKLQASTCNRIISVAKSVFNCAVRWGILDTLHNPCRDLTPFPENTPQTRYLNKAETVQVLTELRAMKDNKNAIALQLLLFTGARKQEILAARWENVNFETHILTIPLSKSGKARHIPLSDEAVKLIHTLEVMRNGTKKTRKNKDNMASPWLFPANDPTKHVSSVYRTWNKVRKKLGLQGVRIHDLRHSFASLLVNAGCSLYEVQKILGHHDPRVTMRYAHLAQSSLVEATNKVGEILEVKK